MPLSFPRVMLWSTRFLSLVVALWWPTMWRDPIYTPRHARLSGQELRLPDGTEPDGPDERALAIFWAWEKRTLVATRWEIGPYRGLRDAEGRMQTLWVLVGIWVLGSGILFLWERIASSASAAPEPIKNRSGFFFTPLWRLLSRFSRRASRVARPASETDA
jgi:hypothetical protein